MPIRPFSGTIRSRSRLRLLEPSYDVAVRTDSDEIRQIEAEAAPTRFARGWHCLGLTRTSATANRTGQRLRPEARGVSRRGRQDQRARRLLPAHGRRPVAGHGEGQRDRLPVPRLALGRRRSVQEGAVQPGARPAGPHRDVAHPGAGRHAVRVERPRAQPAAGGRDDSAHRGRDQRRVDRLALVHHRGRHQLPRDHRQRRRHGALLLHPRVAARRTSRTSSKGTSPPST